MLMFFKKMKKNSKGYTLTELIVVVAILAILAAVAGPMIFSKIGDARVTTDKTNAGTISSAYKIAAATSGAATDVNQAKTWVESTLNPIPKPEQKGYFNLNLTTGECVFSTSAGSIVISQNP